MKESSKRIHAKINVLRHLKEDSTLYDSEGIKLAGDYWFDIKAEVNKRCQGDFFQNDRIRWHCKAGRWDFCFLKRTDMLFSYRM